MVAFACKNNHKQLLENLKTLAFLSHFMFGINDLLADHLFRTHENARLQFDFEMQTY